MTKIELIVDGEKIFERELEHLDGGSVKQTLEMLIDMENYTRETRSRC